MLHTLVIFRGKLRKNDSTEDAKELITHFPHHYILQSYTFQYHNVFHKFSQIEGPLSRNKQKTLQHSYLYVFIGISVILLFNTQYKNKVPQFKQILFKKRHNSRLSQFFLYILIHSSIIQLRVRLRLVFLRSTQLKESYKIIAFFKWTLMPIF